MTRRQTRTAQRARAAEASRPPAPPKLRVSVDVWARNPPASDRYDLACRHHEGLERFVGVRELAPSRRREARCRPA